jgi:polyphosphate kinase
MRAARLAGLVARQRPRALRRSHGRLKFLSAFENAGTQEVYCGSADWMDRNLFRRIEIAFPIDDPELRARVAEELQLYLQDDMQAWTLDTDGRYSRATGEKKFSAQSRLMILYDDRLALTEG